MTHAKFILLIVLNFFLFAGIRNCDSTTTVGFPVVALQYIPEHLTKDGNKVERSFVSSKTGWEINLLFSVALLFALKKLTEKTSWKRSLPFRVGGYATLGYLIYGNIFVSLTALLKNYAGTLLHSVVDGLLWVWLTPLLLWYNLFPLEKTTSLRLGIVAFFPADDDLYIRVILPFALSTIFLLGFLTAKIVIKIKCKRKAA